MNPPRLPTMYEANNSLLSIKKIKPNKTEKDLERYFFFKYTISKKLDKKYISKENFMSHFYVKFYVKNISIGQFLVLSSSTLKSCNFFRSSCRQTYRDDVTRRPPQRQSYAFVLTHLLMLRSRGKSRMQMRSNARRVNIYENELRLSNEVVVGRARAAWAASVRVKGLALAS